MSLFESLNYSRLYVWTYWQRIPYGAKFEEFNDQQHVKWKKKDLLGAHFISPSCVFWAIELRFIYLLFFLSVICLCVNVYEYTRRKTEASRSGRSNNYRIFHVCVQRPLAGISTKLAGRVGLADIIKHSKCHRFEFSGFNAVTSWIYTRSPVHPQHTALCMHGIL